MCAGNCGCGCSEVGVPPIGGVVPKALTGLGLYGLGCTDPIDASYDGDPSTACSGLTPGGDTIAGTGGGSGTPVITYPAPTPNPAGTVNWNTIAQNSSNTLDAILRSISGANPTYQTVGPGGSTTIYGSLPSSLQASLSAPTLGGMSMGTLLLFGVGAIVLVSMMGKR
jgi:hypothetical protein